MILDSSAVVAILRGEPEAEALTGAIAHLDFALKEFQAMKMRPSLDRALSPRERLKA